MRTSERGSEGEGKEAAEEREDVRSGSAELGETMARLVYELDKCSWRNLLVEIPRASRCSERREKGERTSSGSSSSSSSAAGASSSSFSSGASSVEATSVLSACALQKTTAKRRRSARAGRRPMARSPSPSPRPLLLLLDSRRHDGLEEGSEESLGLLLNGRRRRRRGGGRGHGVWGRGSVVREADEKSSADEREGGQTSSTAISTFFSISSVCRVEAGLKSSMS